MFLGSSGSSGGRFASRGAAAAGTGCASWPSPSGGAFLTKSGVDAPVAFTEAGDLLRAFPRLVLSSARSGATEERRWDGRAWSSPG